MLLWVDDDRAKDCLIDDLLLFRRTEAPRVLLLDDDPVFGALLRKAAARRGIELLHLEVLPELADRPLPPVAAALVDYDLSSITGTQAAQVLNLVMPGVPRLLISGYREVRLSDARQLFQGFVSKREGPLKILDAVSRMLPATTPGVARRYRK